MWQNSIVLCVSTLHFKHELITPMYEEQWLIVSRSRCYCFYIHWFWLTSTCVYNVLPRFSNVYHASCILTYTECPLLGTPIKYCNVTVNSILHLFIKLINIYIIYHSLGVSSLLWWWESRDATVLTHMSTYIHGLVLSSRTATHR